ncbi:MAG: hypothetical protein GY845_35425 [Planctomycetes bacterium]|nr:hypothetical protein [Planctomycetota bacterium]
MATPLTALSRIGTTGPQARFTKPFAAATSGTCDSTDSHNPYYVNNYACSVWHSLYNSDSAGDGASVRAMRIGSFCFFSACLRVMTPTVNPTTISCTDMLPVWMRPLREMICSFRGYVNSVARSLMHVHLTPNGQLWISIGAGLTGDAVNIGSDHGGNPNVGLYLSFVYRLANPSATIISTGYTHIENASVAASIAADTGIGHYYVPLGATKATIEKGLADDGLQSPYFAGLVVEQSIDTAYTGALTAAIRADALRINRFQVRSLQGTGVQVAALTAPAISLSTLKPCCVNATSNFQEFTGELNGADTILEVRGLDTLTIRQITGPDFVLGTNSSIGGLVTEAVTYCGEAAETFTAPPYAGYTEAVTAPATYNYMDWRQYGASQNSANHLIISGAKRTHEDSNAGDAANVYCRNYLQGVTTLTLGGPFAVDVDIEWIRINNFVFACITNLGRTLSAANLIFTTTAGAMPVGTRPLYTTVEVLYMQDNGAADGVGRVRMTPAGELEFGYNNTFSAFTNAAVCGQGEAVARDSTFFMCWMVNS